MQRRQLLMGGLLLGGCAANVDPKRPLEFWTMQLKPEHTVLLEGILAKFPLPVKWVDVPWADMERKILAAVAAGTAPDVVNLNPQFAVKLAQRHTLLDFGRQVSPQEQAVYFPNLWQSNRLNGVIFGVPWYISTQITIYNRALFQKAGLDPNQPPRNYQELRQVAQVIHRQTGKYAFLPTFDTAQILEAWVKTGVQLIDTNHQAKFNSPAGLAAANYWVNLYRDQLIPRETLTEGHRKAVELYQAEETALLLSGPQFLESIAKNAPQLAQVTGVSPQLTGSLAKTNASAMNIVVPKNTLHAREAVRLALFITNDRNQLALAKAANLLPSTRQAAQDRFFTAVAPDIATTGRLVSAQQLATAEVLIPPFDNLDLLQKFIYEELQLAMLGKKTAAQAVQSAADKWNLIV